MYSTPVLTLRSSANPSTASLVAHDAHLHSPPVRAATRNSPSTWFAARLFHRLHSAKRTCLATSIFLLLFFSPARARCIFSSCHGSAKRINLYPLGAGHIGSRRFLFLFFLRLRAVFQFKRRNLKAQPRPGLRRARARRSGTISSRSRET